METKTAPSTTPPQVRATELKPGMTISYGGDTLTILEINGDNSGLGYDLTMSNGDTWFIFKGMTVELISHKSATVSATCLICSCGQHHSLMVGQVATTCKCGSNYQIPGLGYNQHKTINPTK